ncbi:hypothetical protein NGB36_11975 [Streptomyces sp. RB6PN25]|uniref:DUF1003 domain-containing protein n=1 Tax=Streptomyces humicola TaxID=2953240 RepID=A0ABT1PUE5_9ACTN|nr:hypothetical protein [Streptomyces humicola]MCQ4081299.1 hypothetical protein [Streptomyces humicola]
MSTGNGEGTSSGVSARDEEPRESLTQVAHPQSRLDRALAWVPRALSSKAHVIFLIALGIYLIILPLTRILAPSANAELIGGNYTNVTSDVGACIAAGGTLHLVRANRKRSRVEEERLRLARETHRLLHHVYAEQARELGQALPDETPEH